MMAETGASGLRPAAITRLRRSRSVTIPNESASSTSAALAPRSVIRLAASRIGSSRLAQQRRRPDQRGHPDLDLLRGCRPEPPGP